MLESKRITDGIWPQVGHLLAPEVVAELAGLAEEADREGCLSEVGLELLRHHKWPGLAVPKQFGGLGASLLECCAVQRKLGGADPGLSIACSMHLGSVGVWNEHYAKHPDMTWVFMEAVATRSLIVASAVAEPSLGGSVSRSTLRARKVDGGWDVSGRKGPLSFSASADLITLQFQSEADGDAPSEVLVALVSRSMPGLSTERTWDTMGMRGSGSDTLVLDRCLVPDPLVVYRGQPGAAADDDIVAGIVWFCLIITASYLGLAEAALGVAGGLLERSRIAHLDAVRAELPSFQGILGQQAAALLTLETSCAGLARAMDARQDPQLLLAAALGLKQHAVRIIPEALGALADACGGIAYSRASTLERFWRDAQAIRFHPPTPVPVAQYLGRRAMGMAAALDLDEAAPSLRRQVVA